MIDVCILACQGEGFSKLLLQLLERARAQIPPDADTGFFAHFIENGEYGLAWKELAATGKDTAAGSAFWSVMADAARLMGMGTEAREARNRAEEGGEVVIRLPSAEAIVLFAFLSQAIEDAKNDKNRPKPAENRAEQHALKYLLEVIEYGLLDPAAPHYIALLQHGRGPQWPAYLALVENARNTVEREWV